MRLRQSTAVAISFGPFVSQSDGVTLKTGLVSAIDHASTGIKLSKNGGALTIRHASVTASSYDGYGNYIVTLDTTDTNTLGTLRVQFADATTNLVVFQDFEVVNANEWDSSFGTTVRKFSDVDQIKTNPVVNGGTVTFTTNSTVASTTGAVGSVTGAVGSVTGLTAADVGAIKAKTDNLPASPASTTNITAGTITTVTNLTNAPTNGDLTTAMKTSVQVAADAAITANTLINAIASYIDTEIATIVTATTAANIRAAVGLASANLDTQLDALPTAAENRDAVWAKTMTELAAMPGVTDTVLAALTILFMALRNQRETTATSDKIENNAGTAIATAVLSDDGTVFTKTKYT